MVCTLSGFRDSSPQDCKVLSDARIDTSDARIDASGARIDVSDTDTLQKIYIYTCI